MNKQQHNEGTITRKHQILEPMYERRDKEQHLNWRNEKAARDCKKSVEESKTQS